MPATVTVKVMHLSISIFPQRGDAYTLGIRQPINPNPWELDRTPKNGVGELDTFSGSSKLDLIINLAAHPGDFGHHIFSYWLGTEAKVFKIIPSGGIH